MIYVWPQHSKQSKSSCTDNLQSYKLQWTDPKLLSLVHDDGKPLADDAWITIRSRVSRISF
ncbi:hypothetical protein OIU78_008431, partial [Salix suchowensis]